MKMQTIIEYVFWALMVVFLVSSYRALNKNTEPASGPGAIGFLSHFPTAPRVCDYREDNHG